jgi:uncharacterized phage protein (TIGR02218 family)
MKTLTTPLLNLINSNSQFYVTEVITISLMDGTPFYFTSLDVDVLWNDHIFSSNNLLIKRDEINQSVGMEVDELNLDIYPSSTYLIGGISFLEAANNGILDGSKIKLERLYFSNWNNPLTAVGGYNLFTGNTSDLEIGRSYIKIKVQSPLELLQVPWPPLVYQPGCVWQLYGNGCALNRSSYTVGGLITSAVLGMNSFSTNINRPDNYYDLGVINFSTGNNTGDSRTIKLYKNTHGVVTTIIPLDNLPEIGDSFTIYPGCDRQLSTCVNKFSNQTKYLGFNFIPQPETMY